MFTINEQIYTEQQNLKNHIIEVNPSSEGIQSHIYMVNTYANAIKIRAENLLEIDKLCKNLKSTIHNQEYVNKLLEAMK